MLHLGHVYILGDSYSTFEGYIPEGYNPWYRPAPSDSTDVTRVEETWWHLLLSRSDGTILKNSSWSGSTICNTGYDGNDYSDHSFIARFERDFTDGFFAENKIDTMFIFGGTNDTWANSPLGTLTYDDASPEALKQALPAIGYLFRRVSETLPDTRVIVMLNDVLKSEIETAEAEAARKFGFSCLRLHNIEKQSGHPDKAGMRTIADETEAFLSSCGH